MRKIGTLLMMGIAAAFFTACTPPATNAPANTNTNANTAKPVAAAPTADVLLDMEKKANEAYAKGDGAYFEGMLSDKAVMSMGKDHMGKADIVSMIKTAKCEMKDGVKLSEPQVSKIDNDTYAFTYKNDTAGSCTEKGKTVEMKPVRASTIWARNGEKWQAVWHGENEIKAAPSTDKKDEAKTDKKDEAKKEEAKPAEPKKDDAKKEEPKKDDKSAANNAAAADAAPAPKLTADANTDALSKTHAAGWEAFRNKDAKWFDSNIASTFAFVDPMGGYHGTKADTIKTWTETMKCEGITKTSFTDGFAQAVSPTVEILMGKGTADGTCDGHKNGDLWQTSVYVKEGDAWKLAYMFESTGTM